MIIQIHSVTKGGATAVLTVIRERLTELGCQVTLSDDHHADGLHDPANAEDIIKQLKPGVELCVVPVTRSPR